MGNKKLFQLVIRAIFIVTVLLARWVIAEEGVVSTETAIRITKAVRKERGIRVHNVVSPYQSTPTKLRVLVPDVRKPDVRKPDVRKPKKLFSVLYVLPVESGDGDRWGNGFDEILKHDLHNQHRLICVGPTFSQLPWYADHPSNVGIRQESHFVKVIVPYIDRHYPTVSSREGRLLVGFSKSGWGAFSLLLRHPKLFGRAAAWDAPLMEADIRRFGMGPIFGTRENFESYCVSRLFQEQQKVLGSSRRLILTGYGSFRSHHITAHQRMQTLEIPHVYRDGPKRPHHWNSGWLTEAIEQLTARSSE